MSTHDIELPPLPKSGWALNHESAFTANDMKAYARAAIEADRKRRFQNGEALQRFKKCGADEEEQDPIERLRFFCSLAMSGQDWLDSEQFFDDLIADRQRRGELVVWPLASPEDAGKGWTLDYRFLEQVEKAASQRTVFPTSIVAAEQVLIAAAELLRAPQPAEHCEAIDHARQRNSER